MIFVTVGSQKFQFNRLLEELDRLVELKHISSDEVFAQIGFSTYEPKYFRYKKFLNNEEFISEITKAEIMITHGGTGSIINGVKQGKKVIGVPRSSEYGEHVDNHQYEIIEQFMNTNMILGLSEVSQLDNAIRDVRTMEFRKYESNTHNIINLLESYLLGVN